MSASERFETLENYTVFRSTGHVSLQEAVQRVTLAIAFAHEQRIRKLLVVTSALTGFESPSLGTRYFFIQDWARVSRGVVRVALVARPEMIDPKKFGVTVARNRGFISDVFASEEEAAAWLQSIK